MATLDDFVSFLQGASNSAASNLSAPVDGINWLLGKAGLPVSKTPVGGSDWLRQAGFTAEPKNSNAGLLGESVGGVMPIVAAAKAPQIAAGLNRVAANAAAPSTMRMKAQRGAVMVGDSLKKGLVYHVAPNGHSGSLLSLYKQHGDDAYDMYAKRWPESGNIGQDHAQYVHLHDSLDDAKKFANQYGGKVYGVDPDALADDWIEVVRDRLEYDHPMVRDEIPAEYLRLIK